jgi:hypothetical protein
MRTPTIGERLAMVLTLGPRSGLRTADRNDMQVLADRLPGAAEKATILDFTEKEIERISTLYAKHFV